MLGGAERPFRAASAHAKRMPGGSKMVVFLALQYIHLSARITHRAAMESVLVPVLSQRTRTSARSAGQKGAEKFQAAEARVRGHVYDRSQRLGWRVDLRSDYNWKNFGKLKDCGQVGYRL